MKIIYDFTTRNYKEGRGGKSIKAIIIHDTGNKTDSAKGNANFFRNEYRGASAHYFVDDNDIVQVVREKDTSWAIGVANYGMFNNSDVINIEMCRTDNKVSEKTLNNTLELVRELMQKYNISSENVLRHHDVCDTPCPSALSERNYVKWFEFKKKLNGANSFEEPSQNEKVPNGDVNSYFKTTAKTGLNVRNGRGTDFKIIGNLPYGTKVKVLYSMNNWSSIDYGDNVGYVSNDYLEKI